MYYTILVFLLWLLQGAPTFPFSFNPLLMAFVIAIIIDLFVNRGVIINRINKPV